MRLPVRLDVVAENGRTRKIQFRDLAVKGGFVEGQGKVLLRRWQHRPEPQSTRKIVCQRLDPVITTRQQQELLASAMLERFQAFEHLRARDLAHADSILHKPRPGSKTPLAGQTNKRDLVVA